MDYKGFTIEYDQETQELINKIQNFIKELTQIYEMKIKRYSNGKIYDKEYIEFLELEYKREIKPFENILEDIRKSIIPKRVYKD